MMRRRNAAASSWIMALALGWAVTLALGLAACDRSARVPRDMPMQDVGALKVGVATAPNPPSTGENVMTIVVKDASGEPARGAAIDAVVSMPAMGAMPYMESRGDVSEAAPGVYRAKYGIAMAGDWDVNLRVRPKSGTPAAGAWRLSTNHKDLAFVGGDANAPAATGHAADSSATGADAPGVVSLDAARRQSLGIQVGVVAPRDLTLEIRAAGRVAYDETRLAEVSLKYAGWVRAIHADFTGRPVRRGQALFDAYSPDLYAAQQEFLTALAAAREDSVNGGGGADLAIAARRRLQLWDVADQDLAAIAREGRPRETLPVRSPAAGVVTEKSVVLGSPFTAGQSLYRIARTDPVWVLASLYEQDLPHVRVGSPVRLVPTETGGRERRGRVAFIAPDLAADTRTGTMRIEVANLDGALKPGMYLDVRLDVSLGRLLAIPESAVLPTGERRIVFVDLGDGRLAPREVMLGARAGEWYEVRSGLAAGERIVTSGNFLVAAESRLRSATGKW